MLISRSLISNYSSINIHFQLFFSSFSHPSSLLSFQSFNINSSWFWIPYKINNMYIWLHLNVFIFITFGGKSFKLVWLTFLHYIFHSFVYYSCLLELLTNGFRKCYQWSSHIYWVADTVWVWWERQTCQKCMSRYVN